MQHIYLLPLLDPGRVAVTTSEGKPCGFHGTGDTRGDGRVSVLPPRSALGILSKLMSVSRKAKPEVTDEEGVLRPEVLGVRVKLGPGLLHVPRLMARWYSGRLLYGGKTR